MLDDDGFPSQEEAVRTAKLLGLNIRMVTTCGLGESQIVSTSPPEQDEVFVAEGNETRMILETKTINIQEAAELLRIDITAN